MDEGDVTKFTDAIKQFDTMTHLVCLVAQSTSICSSPLLFLSLLIASNCLGFKMS